MTWRNKQITDAGPAGNVRLNHPQIVWQKWWNAVGKEIHGGGDEADADPSERKATVKEELAMTLEKITAVKRDLERARRCRWARLEQPF